MNRQNFIELVDRTKAERNLRDVDICMKAGVSTSLLSSIRRGGDPSLDRVAAILRVLDMDLRAVEMTTPHPETSHAESN